MSALPSRTLHLIDLTFLAAALKTPHRTPWSDLAEVDHLEAFDAYRHSVNVQRDDHLVVGVHSKTAARIGWVLPAGVAMRCTTGRAAGLRALLGVIGDLGQVARSYQAATIGSGRAEFAPAVERIAATGTSVTIVAPPSASSELLFVADRVMPFRVARHSRRHRLTGDPWAKPETDLAHSPTPRPSAERVAA